MRCPRCGEDCDRDSVHNGVAMIYGPWGCPSCRWSECEEYDLSNGQSARQPDGSVVDQYGHLYPGAALDADAAAARNKEQE